MGKAELSEAVVPPQHRPHPPFHTDGTVWWKSPCAHGLCKEHQPLLQFQTQGLGQCIHWKWPQRQGPASNESPAAASKSPSKYQFIGLLIKITDSLSDGCPETQGAEKAVKQPRKPSAASLRWFPKLGSSLTASLSSLSFSNHCLPVPTTSQPSLHQQKFTPLRAPLGQRK